MIFARNKRLIACRYEMIADVVSRAPREPTELNILLKGVPAEALRNIGRNQVAARRNCVPNTYLSPMGVFGLADRLRFSICELPEV